MTTSNTNYSVNNSVLTGMFLFAFWQKCIKSGVPENKELLKLATQKADTAFRNNYGDSNSPILQKQFINNCEIEFTNGDISVNF